MRPSPPTSPFSGIMLVGEAPGEHEIEQNLPFVGPAGKALNRMLETAGINRTSCYLTNVFHERPPENKLEHFLTDKLTAVRAYPDFLGSLRNTYPDYPWPSKYDYPSIGTRSGGGYVHPSRLSVLARLQREIATCRPRVICALGNTAQWALTGATGITKNRGTIVRKNNLAIIPTYHPSAVLREWSLRPTVIFDLMKARRVADGSQITRTTRIFLAESPADFHLPPHDSVAIDVETKWRQIRCVSFSTSPEFSLIIPFINPHSPNGSYWPTAEEEILAWKFFESILLSPARKIYHNSLYDITYHCHRHGLRMRDPIEDTMLLHHALYPEVPKSLGHLASIYTDRESVGTGSWKNMRTETGKREDE